MKGYQLTFFTAQDRRQQCVCPLNCANLIEWGVTE